MVKLALFVRTYITANKEINLDKYIGTYKQSQSTHYEIISFNKSLFFVLRDAAVFRKLEPISKNDFIVNEVGYTIKFLEENNKVTGLIYKHNLAEDKWKKMEKIK